MVQTIDSIRVECSCGKKARVPARYAGRRVRCTRCKSQLRVPGSGSSLDALDREVARSAPQTGSPVRRERRSSGPMPARSRVAKSKSTDPYAPPKASVDAPRRMDRNATNRDLAAESHIQAIGVWHRIYAVIMGLACLAMVVFGGLRALPVVGVLGGFAAFCYFLGSSLIAYKGWARIVVGLFTLLGVLGCVAGIVAAPNAGGLFSNLVSLAWNGLTLWALFGSRAARAFSPGYRIDSQRVTWWTSPFFWVPFALLAFAFMTAFAAAAAAI